jgi:GNAT superfamily N-acetyltransferase
MLDICATVWDGEDYLPEVFDAWVAVAEGQFTALELDGKVVALAKLTRLAPGEYWLEGIRVHAAYRGQGLAAALHDYHLDRWRRLGEPGTLRLVTSSDNHAIVTLCERTGFRRLFEFTFAEAPAERAPHRFTPLVPAEAGRAFELVRHLPIYAAQHGLCDLQWKWRELTPAYLAERVAAGAVYRWGDWEAVLVVNPSADEEALHVQFPGAKPGQRIAFLAEVRALAQAGGRRLVRWSPLNRAEVLDDLPPAGYARLWDESLCCFEARQ